MYLRPAFIVALYLFCVLKAQPGIDSLQIPNDTVYINQPPLIIKRQVIIHDTLPAERVKPHPNWYLTATLGTDKWLGNDEVLDSTHFKKRMGYSYSASIGTELHSIYLSVGLGVQQMKLQEQYEKLLTRYDSIVIYQIDTVKLPNGQNNCWKTGEPGVRVCETRSRTITKPDTQYTWLRESLSPQNIIYATIPLRLGKQFKYKKWILSPEIWIVPMFTLESNTFNETQKLRFNKKLTAYKLSINLGREISKKLTIELGGGYQGIIGHKTLDMRFVHLHFGIKYYLFKGTP